MKKDWPTARIIKKFNALTKDQQLAYVKRKINVMKPESTWEAKAMFHAIWEKLKPFTYYKNMKHRIFFPR